jgi:DNA invertase Pin-like site-specific DNA recombinase
MARRTSTSKTAKPRTVAYIRVSTDKQVDEGVSLAAQREKLELYARLHDLELVDVVVDAGVSAKSLDRPGLQRALSMLVAGQADALLVTKLDRLTRSVRDLGALVESHFAEGGASLMSVGESIDTRSAAGRLVLNVLASVSQWEREAIGERTSAAMQYKASRGEYCGGPSAPLGYRVAPDGVQLEPVRYEQAAIRQARQLRKEGLSLRAVAARLEGAGYVSRTGRPFAAVQVQRMLSRATPDL